MQAPFILKDLQSQMSNTERAADICHGSAGGSVCLHQHRRVIITGNIKARPTYV